MHNSRKNYIDYISSICLDFNFMKILVRFKNHLNIRPGAYLLHPPPPLRIYFSNNNFEGKIIFSIEQVKFENNWEKYEDLIEFCGEL